MLTRDIRAKICTKIEARKTEAEAEDGCRGRGVLKRLGLGVRLRCAEAEDRCAG